MVQIEVHLVSSPRESVMLTHGGLPPVHLEPIECGSCGRPIGESGGHFVPVGVILTHQSLAFLCEPCLHPLIKALG
jgi:hypothetical protein